MFCVPNGLLADGSASKRSLTHKSKFCYMSNLSFSSSNIISFNCGAAES